MREVGAMHLVLSKVAGVGHAGAVPAAVSLDCNGWTAALRGRAAGSKQQGFRHGQNKAPKGAHGRSVCAGEEAMRRRAQQLGTRLLNYAKAQQLSVPSRWACPRHVQLASNALLHVLGVRRWAWQLNNAS